MTTTIGVDFNNILIQFANFRLKKFTWKNNSITSLFFKQEFIKSNLFTILKITTLP